MTAVTQLSIINQARVAVGEEVVASVSGVDAMMRAAISNYEDIVLEEIEDGEWRFSVKIGTPDLNSTDLTKSFPYEWLIPADSIGVIALRYQDQTIDGRYFEIRGGSVWSAFGTDVTIVYKYRAPESLWGRRFSSIIVTRLEALFMRGTERHSEAAGRDGEVARKKIIGRHAETRQRFDRPMGDGSIVSRRTNGRTGFVTPPLGSTTSGGGGSTSDGLGYRFITGDPAGDKPVTTSDHLKSLFVDCFISDINLTFDLIALDGVQVTVRRLDSEDNPHNLTFNSGTAGVDPLTTNGQAVVLKIAAGLLIELSRTS